MKYRWAALISVILLFVVVDIAVPLLSMSNAAAVLGLDSSTEEFGEIAQYYPYLREEGIHVDNVEVPDNGPLYFVERTYRKNFELVDEVILSGFHGTAVFLDVDTRLEFYATEVQFFAGRVNSTLYLNEYVGKIPRLVFVKSIQIGDTSYFAMYMDYPRLVEGVISFQVIFLKLERFDLQVIGQYSGESDPVDSPISVYGNKFFIMTGAPDVNERSGTVIDLVVFDPVKEEVELIQIDFPALYYRVSKAVGYRLFSYKGRFYLLLSNMSLIPNVYYDSVFDIEEEKFVGGYATLRNNTQIGLIDTYNTYKNTIFLPRISMRQLGIEVVLGYFFNPDKSPQVMALTNILLGVDEEWLYEDTTAYLLEGQSSIFAIFVRTDRQFAIWITPSYMGAAWDLGQSASIQLVVLGLEGTAVILLVIDMKKQLRLRKPADEVLFPDLVEG